MLTVVAKIARYKNRSSPSLDGLNSGGLLKYHFNSWNAASHLLVHVKACLRVLKKGRHLSVTLETKWLRAATLLVSFCTSLTFLGEVMSSMAFTFFGLASIPCYNTIKPRNFPEETPNKHFVGFNLIRYHLKVLKVSSRLSKWLYTSFLLTSMSSMYTSIFLPICLLNIWFTNL